MIYCFAFDRLPTAHRMSQTVLATIVAKLTDYGEIRLAILFGSLATGRATPDSDIDLAIDAGRPLSTARRIRIITDLAAMTGRPVDLVDLRQAGEPLLGQILRQGKRLLGTDEAYAAWLSRHLLDEADFMPYHRRIIEARRAAWIGT